MDCGTQAKYQKEALGWTRAKKLPLFNQRLLYKETIIDKYYKIYNIGCAEIHNVTYIKI